MKKAIECLIIFAVFISLAGCWDAYEIKDRKIISAIGIDKSEDDLIAIVEFRLPKDTNTQQSGGQIIKLNNLATGKGENLTEMRNSLQRGISNDLFLGAIETLVFSDRYAEYGIEEYLNRLRGLKDYRKTISVYTATAELEELFDSTKLRVENVGNEIDNLHTQLIMNGMVIDQKISSVLESLTVKNTGFLLSNLDMPNNIIAFSGYSVFNNGRKIGHIPPEKTKGINYILLDNAKSTYTLKYDEKLNAAISAEIKKRKIKIDYENNRILFDINIMLECELIDFSKMTKLDDAGIKKIENLISVKVKEDILEAINTSQKVYGCDYLYLYKYFRAKYGSKFYSLDWNKEYSDARFNLTVSSKLKFANRVNYK